MEKSANRVNVEYQLLAPPAEPADSVPPASVLLATSVIGRPSSGAFISSSGELRAVSSPGLRQQAPAAMSAKPRSGYRILLPQVQQLLVSRLQPVVPGSATSPETPPSPPVMSTAQVQFAASAATSSASDLVSRTQAFSFSSLYFPSAPATTDRMTGVMRAPLLSPSDSSASSNTSFFSCNITNNSTATTALVHQPAATVVHVCNPLSTSAAQVNIGPPPTAVPQQRPPQMVLRYHSFPTSQLTSATARHTLAFATTSSLSDLAVVSTSQTSLQVAHTVTTTTSPRPADRLPALQLMPVPGLPIPAAGAAQQHRLILSAADSLLPRLPSPSSQDQHHQPVILQRLSLAPVTGGTRPRQAAAGNISVRSSFPAARDPGAVVGGGVKTVMRTTLVPRSQAASYSDAQINSILQQMVPEPPCSDSLNAEGYDEGSRAAAIAANAEARLQLCPPLPSRQQSQEVAAAAADPELPPVPSSASLSCPSTPMAVSYNAQTSPVIQPLEILQNPFLEPLVMEGGEDEESLENVVIPVIPEHLGELRLPTEKVIKDSVVKARLRNKVHLHPALWIRIRMILVGWIQIQHWEIPVYRTILHIWIA